MRVLFTSLRNTSHFLPLVPFIDACRLRGHEVAVAAPPDLAERAGAAGAEFFPFPHPGDEGLRPIWMRMREVSVADSNKIVISEIFAGACARTALPGLLETAQRWKPAIIVRESQEYATLIVSEQLAIPHARVAITLRITEMDLLPVVATAVDALRRGAGLPPDPAGECVCGEPVLTMFPASLEAPGLAVPQVRRFRATRQPGAPLPEWWGARKEPLVYVTLGTMAGGIEQQRAMYRVALDAAADLPIRVLLTVGNVLPLEALGELPANVHVERFVPQDEVLSHAAAVVCHGGSGTVVGTLAAGVPMVVTPLFADQPYNAERIALSGAGLALPIAAATAPELRRALVRVLEEASFRTAAQGVASEIAALPAVDDAASELERLAHRNGPGTGASDQSATGSSSG